MHMNKSVHDKLNELKQEEINKKHLSCKDVKTTTHNNKSNIIKSKIYFFFLHPTGFKGILYRLISFTIIMGSITIGSMTTIKTLDNISFKTLFWYELFATLFFSIELSLRCWSSSYINKINSFNGAVKLIAKPFILIEIFVILLTSVLLCIYSLNEKHYSNIHSTLRIIQIIRYLYADRNAQTWTMLLKVVLKHKSELLTTFYIAIFILLLSAYLVLLFEKPYSEANDDNHFLTYSDALYWAIITMTTIGFGKIINHSLFFS